MRSILATFVCSLSITIERISPYGRVGVTLIVFLLINAFVWKEVAHLVGNYHTRNLRCETKSGEHHFHDEDKVEDSCLICHLLNTHISSPPDPAEYFTFGEMKELRCKQLPEVSPSSRFSSTLLRGPPGA